jgi:muramoyltetrapeptide carboxypeptidase
MPSRRRFLAAAASAAACLAPASRVAGGEPGEPAQTGAAAASRRGRPIKPGRLSPGDRVGLVAPATATFFPVDVDIARDTLAGLGLEAVLGEHLLSRRSYFAGTDEERAADINGFFADSSISGLVALHGGWGCARLLPLLDYDTIARHPKALVGYSDVTALLDGIHAKTGLVTFHGPVGVSRWNSFNQRWFRDVAFEGRAVTFANETDADNDELAQRHNRIRTITGGRTRGPLLGGNLTVLTSIVGSPYVPDFDGAILFLEDTDEAPYRVDRMITQLRLAGILDRVNGVVFGACTDCEPPRGSYASLTLEEILTDHLKPLGIPAWHGAMIGHIERQFTLPLGIDVEIDADRGTIEMKEGAVA